MRYYANANRYKAGASELPTTFPPTVEVYHELSLKRIIVENCPGLSVAVMGKPGTIGQVYVRNSPGAKVSDSLTALGTKSGAMFTIIP